MAGITTDQHIITYISCLNGLPISKLANISSISSNISDDTEFLLAQQIGNDDEQTYVDAKVTYKTIIDKLSADIPVGQMMQHDTYEYATASHVHSDYSWFKVWPDFGPNGKNKNAEVSATIATVHFKSNGKQNDVDICLPAIHHDNQFPRQRHLIGEFMFVAANSFKDIIKQVGNVTDINAQDFSGWVYADGATYQTTPLDFMDAKVAFGSMATDTSFTVPDFSGFCQPTGDVYGKSSFMEKLPGCNSVPIHTHDGILFAESKSSSNKFQTIPIDIQNGRGSCNGEMYTQDLLDRKNPKQILICAWPNDKQDQPPDGALPAARPAGYREISNQDTGIFSLQTNDLQFASAKDEVKFTITGLSVKETGTDYDESDEDSTMSWPEHAFVPVLVYVGFPNNNQYSYWE